MLRCISLFVLSLITWQTGLALQPPADGTAGVAVASFHAHFAVGDVAAPYTGIASRPDYFQVHVAFRNDSTRDLEVQEVRAVFRRQQQVVATLQHVIAPVRIPAGTTVFTSFEIPLERGSRINAACTLEVTPSAVQEFVLENAVRQSLRTAAQFRQQIVVRQITAVKEYDVPLGMRGALRNQAGRPAAQVRLLVLGYDRGGKLVESQILVLANVPQGSSTFSNWPPGDPTAPTLEAYAVSRPLPQVARYEALVLDAEPE